MYKRNKSVNSNFYLLRVVRDVKEDGEVGEELATIYSEDPIPKPDEGNSFDISLLQLDGENDNSTEETKDSFRITDSHQSYAIIEHDDDHQALLHSTVMVVEFSEG